MPTSDLGALATETQAEEDEGANVPNSGNDSIGSNDGRSSGLHSKSRFVCINNNNNNVGDRRRR